LVFVVCSKQEVTSSFFQIEDLNQQAQVAAAEKFKAPEVSPAAEAGGSTTVKDTWRVYYLFSWKDTVMSSFFHIPNTHLDG
jgi:hypothetical protein